MASCNGTPLSSPPIVRVIALRMRSLPPVPSAVTTPSRTTKLGAIIDRIRDPTCATWPSG